MRNQYDPNDMRPDYGSSGSGRHGDMSPSMQRKSDMPERQHGQRFNSDDDYERGNRSQARDAYGHDTGTGNLGFSGNQGSGDRDYRWQDNNQVRYGSDGYGEGAQGYYGGQQQSHGYHGQDQAQHDPAGYHGQHRNDSGYREHSGEASGMRMGGGYGPGHSMRGLARYDQDYNPPLQGNRGPGGYRDYDMRSSGHHGMGRGGTHQGPWNFNSGYGDHDGHTRQSSPSRSGMSGYEASGTMDREGSGARSFRGVGPRGYTRSDERLCEDINERLTDDDYIDASDISFSIKDGEVTLSGDVPERRLKHYIEDLVERCHGVREIHNKINVSRTRGGNNGNKSTGNGNGKSDNDSSSSTNLQKK